MKKLLVVAACGVGVVFFGGCATLGSSARANLTIVNVRPTTSTLLESGVELTLRVLNETDRPLEITGSSHKLALNGSSVGRAVSDRAVSVPALGTTTMTVTVYVENIALLRKFGTGQRVEQVAYRLDSRLFTSGSGTISVSNEDLIDLRPLLQGLQGMR